MEYTRLGNTGLNVSRICFGCMWFGRPGNGGIDVRFGEDEAREVIRYAWERGINFFDTANYYSLGASEEVLGKVIAEMGVRDDAVIATKSYYPMYEGTNAKGVTRKTLFREVDASLKRLGTDYIDLYVPHRLDHDTPMEEQMEALNDLVRSGKVLYIGASAMYAWQFLKMNMIAESHGWAEFVSMQDMYNLVYREEEKEMHPMLLDQGIACTPFSSLAHGVFAKRPEDERTDGVAKLQNDYVISADAEIIRRVWELAERNGVSTSVIAQAWNLAKPVVTSPLIGASKTKYIDDAITALNLKLTADEMAYLEEPYVPHTQYGFR